jgi:Ca2+/H+ antiporter, TMEM165/GDT1 family
MNGATWGLLIAVFLASVVEFVEALTIVIAMGATRGWRSALAGTAVAVLALAGATSVAGVALVTWLPEAALQAVIGTLLLIFGLQWLRKAILRSAGLKAMHDEAEEYAANTEAARSARSTTWRGIDTFAFVVAFKGVFLEGVEVVFIVITFGLTAHNLPVAVYGAAAGGVVVIGAGVLVHRPLTAVPENLLKYGVGLLLTSFGTFWALEGIGVFGPGRQSLRWPGSDLAILALLALWFGLSRVLIRVLPRLRRPVVELTSARDGG